MAGQRDVPPDPPTPDSARLSRRTGELRQGAFEIVPDHQHVALLEELDGPAALLGGGTLVEFRPLAVFAEHGDHAVGAGELLEADEARAVAEQAAARPPLRGLGGQRGLAHAAHRMEHDAAVPAKQPFQLVQLPGPALEAILRRTREAARLAVLRRRPEPAPAAGVLGVERTHEGGQPRQAIGVLGGIEQINPEQVVEVLRQVHVFEAQRDDVGRAAGRGGWPS